MKLAQLRWPQVLALGTGGFLLLWGIAGCFVTGFSPLVGHLDTAVLGIRVNPLANVVHLVTGVAFMIVAPGVRRLGTAAVLLSGLYLVMFGIGTADDPTTNVFNVNGASNGLHLLVGFAGMAVVQGAVWMRQCDKISASAS